MVKHIGENLHPNFSLSLKIHNTCSISAAFEESHKKGSVVPLFNPISQISKDPPHCYQRDHLEGQVCYPFPAQSPAGSCHSSQEEVGALHHGPQDSACVVCTPRPTPTCSALALPPSTPPFALGATGHLSDPWAWTWSFLLLQEGGPLSGPESGLLFNTWKWIVWGDTCADKARDFIGKGHAGGEQERQGTQGNSSAKWLAVSGFMAMALVSGLSLANHSDADSFLVAHSLLSQDGCQQEGFWEVVRRVSSPFDLFQTLPVSDGLLVPCSLLRLLVVK